MRVAGVDGCRGGWAVASDEGCAVVRSFADVLALGFDVVGVDMPIGLLDGPERARACDVEARRRLGVRRSSVFPAPLRPALGCGSWASAAAVYRGLCGGSLSVQAFGLFAKVAEVDAVVRPGMPVYEVHPELSFSVLAGAPMRWAKRRVEGRAERLAALAPSFGDLSDVRVRGAAGDDVLDAYAVLWSARRIAAGEAVALGDGSVDARGLPMRILA